MRVFQDIMKKLHLEMETMEFPQILRQSRDRIGLMQYRAAEFLGMRLNRLKNLETGYFRQMPREEELNAISEFYEIPLPLLTEKAEAYTQYRQNECKIRIISDGTSSMCAMQKR